jgi:universal stress protein A
VNESIITSNEKLQMMIDRYPESKEVKIITDVRRGIPFEEILKNQQEQEIDLIVIASHGRTDLIKPFIGSVAERVMRGAKCTVLLEV